MCYLTSACNDDLRERVSNYELANSLARADTDVSGGFHLCSVLNITERRMGMPLIISKLNL